MSRRRMNFEEIQASSTACERCGELWNGMNSCGPVGPRIFGWIVSGGRTDRRKGKVRVALVPARPDHLSRISNDFSTTVIDQIAHRIASTVFSIQSHLYGYSAASIKTPGLIWDSVGRVLRFLVDRSSRVPTR